VDSGGCFFEAEVERSTASINGVTIPGTKNLYSFHRGADQKDPRGAAKELPTPLPRRCSFQGHSENRNRCSDRAARGEGKSARANTTEIHLRSLRSLIVSSLARLRRALSRLVIPPNRDGKEGRRDGRRAENTRARGRRSRVSAIPR